MTSVFIPPTEFAGESPSLPPPLPSHPPSPPAVPGFRNDVNWYTLQQELVYANSGFTLGDAYDRCRPFASSIRTSFEGASTTLIPAPPECGDDFMVVNCGYVAPREVIQEFNKWVATSPLPPNPKACAPMQVVRTGVRQFPTLQPPPLPPPPDMPPQPPRPPPAPGPSPPPPPPSSPPMPPHGPPPPGEPPLPPLAPPSPPPLPTPPPQPPRSPQSTQVLNEMLCHPTCVSDAPPLPTPSRLDVRHFGPLTYLSSLGCASRSRGRWTTSSRSTTSTRRTAAERFTQSKSFPTDVSSPSRRLIRLLTLPLPCAASAPSIRTRCSIWWTCLPPPLLPRSPLLTSSPSSPSSGSWRREASPTDWTSPPR